MFANCLPNDGEICATRKKTIPLLVIYFPIFSHLLKSVPMFSPVYLAMKSWAASNWSARAPVRSPCGSTSSGAARIWRKISSKPGIHRRSAKRNWRPEPKKMDEVIGSTTNRIMYCMYIYIYIYIIIYIYIDICTVSIIVYIIISILLRIIMWLIACEASMQVAHATYYWHTHNTGLLQSIWDAQLALRIPTHRLRWKMWNWPGQPIPKRCTNCGPGLRSNLRGRWGETKVNMVVTCCECKTKTPLEREMSGIGLKPDIRLQLLD